MSKRAWWLTGAVAAAFVLLTLGDILSTLASLRNGTGVELNPNAARADGGIRIGFLVLSNALLLIPLLGAFVLGIGRAGTVPTAVLTYWWRHVFDIFFIKPLDHRARTRSPLRLVTATMTLLNLKVVILANNLLAAHGIVGPVSLLASACTSIGLTGGTRYWTAYLLLILPCYVAAVGIGARLLAFAAAPGRASLQPSVIFGTPPGPLKASRGRGRG
ncbi:hypothetical protein [Polymorphobacter megasporae]|uniref:hypothetical protein n=1 Tax=Glacieibacterium megasporae TaxID=2835787 RepID=UPI001C1E184C|nr:hypothetical protein [Polymorphobacter megasporae]UAJ08711.1 hypothetical protein KTC28_09910 [Polymorphobacter megasporae]